MARKLYPDAASALDGLLRDGLLIACGGFGLCGIPERLLDAVEMVLTQIAAQPEIGVPYPTRK